MDIYFLPLNNGNGYIKVALEVKLHWQHLRHAIHRALALSINSYGNDEITCDIMTSCTTEMTIIVNTMGRLL